MASSTEQVGRPILAVLAGVVASICFSLSDAGVKVLSAGLPVIQIIFWMAVAGGVVVCAILLVTDGRQGFRADRPGIALLRAVLLTMGTIFSFNAVSRLPLSEAYAIFFASPAVITLMAALVLAERIGPRRLAAVVLGFVGILVVLRPGLTPISLGHLFALGMVVMYSSSIIVLRGWAREEKPAALLATLFVVMAVGAGLAGGAARPLPSVDLWPLLIAAGLLAASAHTAIVFAYRLGAASLIAPLQYLQMAWGVVLGLMIFGDRPDLGVVAGSLLIMASGLLIAHAARARERAAETVPPSAR